jgi:excinuclease ABC subunit A
VCFPDCWAGELAEPLRAPMPPTSSTASTSAAARATAATSKKKPVEVAAQTAAAAAAVPTAVVATTAHAAGGKPAIPVVMDPRHSIRVRGAREHNLKNIDVDIPRDKLVVITGLSGSGKSSLAFDTIFAEGQRKYMESLSAYARQFLDQLKKPDVDDIQGLPPTIAIEQRSSGHNPRSTVATSTEIYDYLRLLYARCGHPTCWHPTKVKKDGEVVERCGRPITATPSTQIIDAVMAMGTGEGRKAMILAPVVRAKKGFHRDVLEEMQKQGWGRVRVNGELVEVREALKDPGENPLKLGRYEKHNIDVVIDRVVLKTGDVDGRQRVAESVESALKLAEGTVVIALEKPGAAADAAAGDAKESKDGKKPKKANAGSLTKAETGWEDKVYSRNHACAEHPECSLEELSPRLFSFNSPQGACPECHGLGVIMEFNEDLVIPDVKKGLGEGAIHPYRIPAPMGTIYRRQLRRFCKDFGVSPIAAVGTLSEKLRRILMHGTTEAEAKEFGTKFPGVAPTLKAWYEKTESSFIREWLGGYMMEKQCPTCRGDRLRIESLSVQLHSEAKASPVINIAELCRRNIKDATAFLAGLKLSKEETVIAEAILKEIRARLGFLMSVGLEYLSLDRRTATLSGGEAQRIRLATQVGSGLVGAAYVLDEPTIGLHQRDNARLISTLRHLCDIGNTVLVVEHDEDMIRAADWVLDVGPGPGVHGGRVVAQGTVPDLMAVPGSITGDYLSGRRKIDVPAKRRPVSDKRSITIKGARQNNLKSVDVTVPLGGLVCVTGVSGSGKSTLVNDILLAGLKKKISGGKVVVGAHDKILNTNLIDRVIEVDQTPIGRTPRSNPATYTGVFDEIRKVFAETKEAKLRGYKVGRFSFNVTAKNGGGRCEACEGQGLKRIEMHFLPDVYVACESCNGSRYNRETLEVKFRGKSIADVLDMTTEDACTFFENHPKILRHTMCLRDVGLAYVKLGQPSTQLSGGEAQRIKLATELAKGTENPAGAGSWNELGAGGTLYVLDEPTTGLHFEDIRKLVTVMNRLADQGNTLVVIEHNLDVIKCADWIIDLGPNGGTGGGTIVAAGTPEQVAAHPTSYTGEYLAPMLK